MVNTFPLTIENVTHDEDVVNWYLYQTTFSRQIQNKRWRARLVLPVSMLVLGVFLYTLNSDFLSIIYISIGAAWYFFYPSREKKLYQKHFQRWVKENLKISYPHGSTLTFMEDHLVYAEANREQKVNYAYIQCIHAIKGYYFLHLNNGECFIFNLQKTDNTEPLENCIQYLLKVKHVPYKEDLQWVWR